MPSPFPGMDPFLEDQEWTDFHASFITAIRDALNPRMAPSYLARVERRVYLEHHLQDPEDRRAMIPDVSILQDPSAAALSEQPDAAEDVAAVECLLPMPEEQRESYLEIRLQETREIVTVIEVLSPNNKRPGSDGRREYLSKRQAVLESRSHLVEIDLLLGGRRPPIIGQWPPGDYAALVSRSPRRPKADIYAWSLRRALPSIPVPLKGTDPEIPLDLQEVFSALYDRARYDLSLDYRRPLSAPLSEEQAAWVRGIVDRS